MAFKRKKKPPVPGEPQKLPPVKVRVWRPAEGDWGRQMDLLSREHAPEGVPHDAVFLVSYLDLPGDNTQRNGHWAKNSAWKEQVKTDFMRCRSLQPGPVFDHPQVRIVSHVAGLGDTNNRLSRVKYVIDLLQVYRESVAGKRLQGMCDLIANDDILTDHNRQVEEIRSSGYELPGKDRHGRALKEARRMVMVWIWNQESPTPLGT